MLHFLHSFDKKLYSLNNLGYFHPMRLIVLLSVIFCSFSATADCVNGALNDPSVNINPQSVSKDISACIPVSENRCEMTIKVTGSTIGSMSVACTIDTDTFIEIITPYSEIGQY